MLSNKKLLLYFALISFLIVKFSMNFLLANTVSIEEVAKITTFRENQISGYGLVVGLPKTGDSKNKLGEESLKKILEFNGIDINNIMLKSKNIAAVWVTAKIPSFSRFGDKIDIWISSIGDAKSLSGGYLLQSPLYGADQQIYAVAQSTITENTPKSSRRTYSNDKNTTVYVPKAAIIERKVSQPFFIEREGERFVQLSLFDFHLRNAERIVDTINNTYTNSAVLTEDAIIEINAPQDVPIVSFISQILSTKVEYYREPKIVINSRTGTIVMGKSVKISASSILQDKSNENKNTEYSLQSIMGMQSAEAVGMHSFSEEVSIEIFMQQLTNAGFSIQEIIPVLKSLHLSGAIHAKLIIL